MLTVWPPSRGFSSSPPSRSASLIGVGLYYWRVVRPQLEQVTAAPPDEVPATEALATFVEQLQELARLRDQGLLTNREFTAKKTDLLDRI